MPDINYLAVLVSAIGFMVVGFLWYGPLFGKIWMEGVGINPNDEAIKKQMQKTAGPAYAQMFIGALLTSFVLANILWANNLALPDSAELGTGIIIAFWVWIGFIVPVKYGEKLWAGKKFKYVAIDMSYYLVSLVLAGVIISLWQ